MSKNNNTTNKLSKFRENLNKKGFVSSFSHITQWASSANLSLNYIVTGRLDACFPNKRTSCIAGPQGSGKSLLLGNIAKDLQAKGYKIVYIDTETAIDEEFLTRIGVSLDEEDFIPVRIDTVEECTSFLSELFSSFDEDEKLGVLLDSMSNLELKHEMEKFDNNGELAVDYGRFPRAIKQLTKNATKKVSNRDMFFIYTLHTYENQNIDGSGKWKVSGGEAQLFIPSISIMLDKLNLKEGSEQVGIRMKATTKKTRYNQLGLKTEIEIPWKTGIDPYFGVLGILERHGIVKKSGAWYSYEKDGQAIKFQKKNKDEHMPYLIEVFNSMIDQGEIEEGEDYDEDDVEDNNEEEESNE